MYLRTGFVGFFSRNLLARSLNSCAGSGSTGVTGIGTRTREIADNSDILAHSLKKVDSTETLLEFVANYHKVMNNQHLILALRTLFQLQKANKFANITDHPDFRTLCLTLKRKSSFLELNQVVEALKVVSSLEVPSNSTIVQSLLQLVRKNVNQLSLQQIIFLDYILKRFKPTPLSDALLIALPIVFQVNLPLKIDRDNESNLVDILLYISKNPSLQTNANVVIDAICAHKNITLREAINITWSLCDMDHCDSITLLNKSLNVIVENNQHVTLKNLEIILTKLLSKYSLYYPEYYHRDFCNIIMKRVIEEDAGFHIAYYIVLKIMKFSHKYDSLLDYISIKCHENNAYITHLNLFRLSSLCMAFSYTSYRPRYWSSVYESIVNNIYLSDCPSDFNWPNFCTTLALLDVYDANILKRTFSLEYVEKFLQKGSFNACRNLLVLNQAVSTLHPEFQVSLPKDALQNLIRKIKSVQEEYPLQGALEKGFGGKNYVQTCATTLLGHEIHHAVILRKGGYPIAFSHQNDMEPIVLEQVQVPDDSQIVVILGFKSSNYDPQTLQLRQLPKLIIKTIEACGFSVVIIPVDNWLQMSDFEKIPYLMREIKLKCEASEKRLEYC